MKKELCPAWQQKCRKCGGRNHFAKVCQSNGQHEVNAIGDNDPEDNSEESDDSHYDFLSGIDVQEYDVTVNAIDDKTTYKRFVYTEMLIGKVKVHFQIDCGASVNIINEKYTEKNDVQPTAKTLKMWNGTELKPLGITRLIVKNPKILNRVCSCTQQLHTDYRCADSSTYEVDNGTRQQFQYSRTQSCEPRLRGG